MTEWNCEEVLARLPEVARGLDGEDTRGVREHLEACATCREEWEVVALLAEAGPAPVPPTLEARLQAAVRADAARGVVRRPRPFPAWRLAAAAGVALAIATPVLVNQMSDRPLDTLDDAEVTAAVGERLPSPWLDDVEGIVAGAPVLDGLSDEALEQLLEEMGE